MQPTPNNHARTWLTLLLLCCTAALALWSNGAYDVDDAPITYRYAEHLAAGQGFTYNDGEFILGTSTPLYTLILATLRTSGVPVPFASNGINFVSTLVLVWVTITLATNLSSSVLAGWLAALYLLLQGSFVRFTMSGMETPLYTLLILSTFLAVTRQQIRLAAGLAGLAFVMRLDGLAVGGALLLGLWLQRRRLPWREGLLYLAIILPWVLFAFWYFGSPIPLSMAAKQHHLQVTGSSRYWIWNHLFITAFSAPTFLLPVAFPGLFLCYRQSRQSSHLLIPLLWLIAYLAAYTLVGIEFYEWYLMPVYPVLAILIGAGMSLVLKAIAFAPAAPGRQWMPMSMAGLLLLFWVVPYGRHMVASVNGYKAYLAKVEGSRAQAGDWLRDHTAANSKVHAGAIGYIGYQSARYVIDGAGLITPAARLAESQPDYYVLEGSTPDRRECGALLDFNTGAFAAPLGYILISRCRLAPLGTFGAFTLANLRITNWVQGTAGHWQEQPRFFLESQWLIEEAQPAQARTLFVHFTDGDGNTLFQADHELGLQSDHSIRTPADWDPTQRIYMYTELPDAWESSKAKVAAIRVGLWNPLTQERLPITAGRSTVDSSGRLVIPVEAGAISQQEPIR